MLFARFIFKYVQSRVISKTLQWCSFYCPTLYTAKIQRTLALCNVQSLAPRACWQQTTT